MLRRKLGNIHPCLVLHLWIFGPIVTGYKFCSDLDWESRRAVLGTRSGPGV